MTLAGLPGFGYHDRYAVDLYLKTASLLQALGPERGPARLLELARSIDRLGGAKWLDDEGSMFVLCRMLFTARPGKEFRRPYIGGPTLFGRTTMADWPLEPIELVDGIPFLIVEGYTLGGVPEASERYVRYCREGCRWADTQFRPRTPDEKQRALSRLLADKRWKRPLDSGERAFLEDQIR